MVDAARRSEWGSALALGLVLMAATAGAREGDRELRDALPALVELAKTHPLQAEPMFEMLTRSHPHDPRPWLFLARLRIKVGAAWAAELPLRRAADTGPASYWESVQKLQVEARLPRLPDRGEIVELDVLRERAGPDACLRRRADPEGARTCPVSKAALVPVGAGRFECPTHPGDREGEPFTIPAALVREALKAGESWIRSEALRRVDCRLLNTESLRRLLAETDPEVRMAVLERLLGAAAAVDFLPVVPELARAYASDTDFRVRELAWRLAYAAGEVPAMSDADLSRLVVLADRGHASKYLVRDVFTADPARGQRVLATMLGEPGLEGKSVALRVLAMDGGKAGALALAQALVRPNGALLMRKSEALRALVEATGEDHGRDPSTWVAALSR